MSALDSHVPKQNLLIINYTTVEKSQLFLLSRQTMLEIELVTLSNGYEWVWKPLQSCFNFLVPEWVWCSLINSFS